MLEKNYLLKVLGLSGIPKLVTFGLTLISFPLLLRALGAETYGSVLYIGAALSLFEVLVDFGVSSAAGKSMATVRAHQPAAISGEFFAWAKLQATFVVLGFVPMLLAAYLIVKDSPTFQDTTLLLVMSVSVVFSVVPNFIRHSLQSLLAFKSLAVLDTSESIIRSSGLLLVAFLFPSALGLAYAGLATVISASLLAIGLITLRLSEVRKEHASVRREVMPHWPGCHTTVKSRLRESANFLWLRLSTRLFQEGPMLILGRLSGAETVGVVGAFRKVTEILGTPYLVIGNALMVRVHDVARQGRPALQSLWDTAMRIASTSLFFAALVFLMADPLAKLLLPESGVAAQLFSVMAVLVVTHVVFAMVAPMSDYLGGLFNRNTFLTAVSVLQLPVLWLAGMLGNLQVMLIAYVAVNVVLSAGYSLIASKVFFGNYVIRLKSETRLFSLGAVSALVLALLFARTIEMPSWTLGVSWAGPAIGFIGLLGLWLISLEETRSAYFNKHFFEIVPTEAKVAR